jgi:3alpha(or 20beta)-hydroxysteroid dehydrogenase
VSTDVLEGRVALITGAGSPGGQGAAEARLFARAGARVIVTDVEDARGAAVVAELGGRGHYRHLDVTSEEQWRECLASILGRHDRLDVLINNAGMWLAKGVVDTTPEEYRRVVEVNQTSVFLGMHVVAPVMRSARSGSIINVSSTAGLRGAGMPHAYAASKWAVRGMTKAAAHELAPFDVRVNSIHPGVIDTPMIEGGHEALARGVPMGRLGAPEEVADLALFLASDASGYISGAEITVDGAVTA